MDYTTFEKLFKNKKAVIFDLDGTLVDTMKMWDEVDSILIDKFGGKPMALSDIAQRRNAYYHSNNSGDIYLGYAGFLNQTYNTKFTDEEVCKLRSNVADYFLINTVKYKGNADKFLRLLIQCGYKLAIATTGSKKCIDFYKNDNLHIINNADMTAMFGDRILTREDVDFTKPNPEVFLKTIEMLRLKKEDCIIFEDSLMGVAAAKSADIDTIVIYDESAIQDRAEIDKICPNFISGYDVAIKHLRRFLESQDENE